jgi:DNA-binding MarR family transcriptional regulator
MDTTLKHFQEGGITAFFAAAKIIADIKNSAKAERNGLSMPTKRVLILHFLSKQPNHTAASNSISFELAENQLSNDYKELEELGYIDRNIHKEDRRKAKVTLTKKGLNFLQKYCNFVNATIEKIADRQIIDELEYDSLPH